MVEVVRGVEGCHRVVRVLKGLEGCLGITGPRMLGCERVLRGV